MAERDDSKRAGGLVTAPLWARVLVLLVDWTLALGAAVAVAAVAGAAGDAVSSPVLEQLAFLVGWVGMPAVLVAYWLVPAAVADGRTLGQRLLGLRTVNGEGGPAGYGAILLRELGLKLVPALVTGGVWMLASGVAALTDSGRRRAIHDRVAGTRVIWERAARHGGRGASSLDR